MLSRIYGTAWRDQKELDAYLHQLEEAERRDHRRIGREMDLFHMQEEATGSVFWHPKGWTLYRAAGGLHAPPAGRGRLSGGEDAAAGGPQAVGSDRTLGEFREHMFIARVEDEDTTLRPEADELPLPRADLQPGPAHLPRTAAAAWPSSAPATATSRPGALHGIMRVRAFTQDDAHIFCTEDADRAGDGASSWSCCPRSTATSASTSSG